MVFLHQLEDTILQIIELKNSMDFHKSNQNTTLQKAEALQKAEVPLLQ
jgi:hypothetical protein